MKCPKCEAEMAGVVYGGVEVDRCSNCQGLWFDTGELAKLRRDNWMADYVLDRGEASVGKYFNRVTEISCPRCGGEMKQESDERQPHIWYESCAQGHGTFLDAGEFKDLVHETFWDRFKSRDKPGGG